MDRLSILNQLSNKLEGKTVFQKKAWLLMDKQKKLFVKGNPQNRWICFVDDTKDRKRVLTYNSKGSANNAGLGYHIFRDKEVQEFIDKTYGKDANQREFLEPVEAEIIVRLKYEN